MQQEEEISIESDSNTIVSEAINTVEENSKCTKATFGVNNMSIEAIENVMHEIQKENEIN